MNEEVECPGEVLLLIFESLDIRSLFICMRVSLHWRRVIQTHPKLFWWKHRGIKSIHEAGSMCREVVEAMEEHIVEIRRPLRDDCLVILI